ncbi:MAG: PAS domain-containing protein [Euryarchaeota archaeon]|nr:PAS domain-containing protein [Euryarchaeota archaeon]
MCLLDRESVILTCNRAMSRIFGRAREGIVGRRCCEVVHGSPRARRRRRGATFSLSFTVFFTIY